LSTELVGRTEDKYHTILDDAFQWGVDRKKVGKGREERERRIGGDWRREEGRQYRCVIKLEYNSGCSTRGNKYKLLKRTFYYDLRKYYFSARIIYIWNSLPNCVVGVSTINQFKARSDFKFWMHQDVLHDYTADLTGIGDRSVHETNDV